jgi:hypothetical protein
MMKLQDATRLAVTKLRTRKVRLVVTVVIAGLLFSVLSAASQVSRGAFASVASFSKEGLGERYILAAGPISNSSVNAFTDPEIIARAKEIQKELVARKTAEAKRLGVDYDPKSEQSPVEEFDSPQGKQASLQFNHPAALQALKETAAKHPVPGLPELKKIVGAQDVHTFYESRMMSYNPGSPSLKILKDGKEPYDQQQAQQPSGPSTGTDGFTQNWSLLSRGLLQPFMLPGASTVIGKDGSLPVVAPNTAVEQLLGFKALPASATPQERLDRLKLLRQKAKAITFQVCYRNQASSDLLNKAISQRQELDQNKNNKDYVKPDIIYALPAAPCTAPTIEKDSRSAEAKKQAAKQEAFDSLFAGDPADQQLITFRVIGIAPDPAGFGASGVSSIVSSLLASNLGANGGWYSPLEVQDANKLIASAFDTISTPGGSNVTYYVETPTVASAKNLLDKQSCQPDFGGPGKGGPGFDPYAKCRQEGKLFSFYPYGSNSLALQDTKSLFSKFFTYAALGVAAIAALIMVGTVGRIIADSRRETAVFRAIGAKKFDIIQIYLIYAFFLSVFIYLFALVIGFVVSSYIQHRFGNEFTIQALVAYNAQDLSRTFSLHSFYVPDMLKLLGLALAGGALSATFPLFRNLRRNPIRDMRDDT